MEEDKLKDTGGQGTLHTYRKESMKILDQVEIDKDKLRFVLASLVPAEKLRKEYGKTKQELDDIVALIAELKPIKEVGHG